MLFIWKFLLLAFLCHQQACLGQSEDMMVNPVDVKNSVDVNVTTDVVNDTQHIDGDGQLDILARSSGSSKLIKPHNIAILAEESATLLCRGRSGNMEWKFTAVGDTTTEAIVGVGCKTNKRYIDSYDVDKSKQSCNLLMESVSLDLAGTYTCLDRSARSSTATAVLVVLESHPVCHSSVTTKSVSPGTTVQLSCYINYAGSIAPVMEWTNEFGEVMESHLHSNETTVWSTLEVMDDGNTVRPYTCKTFFNHKFVPDMTSKTASTAINELTYSMPWRSNPLMVHKG